MNDGDCIIFLGFLFLLNVFAYYLLISGIQLGGSDDMPCCR